MVKFIVVKPVHQGSSPYLTLVLTFSWIYVRLFGTVHSVQRDVPSTTWLCGDFFNLKMLCRLNISEVLIEIGCECVHSSIVVSVYACI